MSVSVGDHRSLEDSDIETDYLKNILESVFQHLGLPAGDIEFTLVDDHQISVLNEMYRQKASPTNVLSFAQYSWDGPLVCNEEFHPVVSEGPPLLWGEVIVSCETVRREAFAAGVDFLLEMIRICIHGMLHLFGYDHEFDQDYEVMMKVEEDALRYAKNRIQAQE